MSAIETTGPLLYREGYKYRVEKPLGVKTPFVGMAFVIRDASGRQPWAELKQDGWMWAYEGYCCDGPSGPTYDWPCSIRPATFHDIPYQGSRLGVLPDRSEAMRKRVDEFFREFLIHDGMSTIHADLWYEGVRIGAASSWARRLEVVHESPTGNVYEVLPGSEYALRLLGGKALAVAP